MKKYLFILILLPLFYNCSDTGFNNRNPFIPNYSFAFSINTSLPSYNDLLYTTGAVYIPSQGARGLIVFNNGSGYNAFDAACPNQTIGACSTMTIKGINAICPCDSREYSLFTGQGGLEYPLKQYRVEVNGNMIRVYN